MDVISFMIRYRNDFSSRLCHGCFKSPYGDALVHTFAPEHPFKLILPIITLVGGSRGLYYFWCT